MNSGYHTSRLVHDSRRDVLWKALWRFHFSRQIAPTDTVLDLGCGYGNFINNVVARRRIGLDQWHGSTAHLAPGVESVVAPVTDLSAVEEHSIDFAFASNLFEHVPQSDFAQALKELRTKLSPDGTLNILQPNYRFSYIEYFDDYTHVSVYSHITMTDFLLANGFEVIDVIPRFLPLTVKSKFPVSPILIWLYLKLPIKPFGKQMLVRARVKN